MAKLGEVCKLVNGYAFKPSDWTEEGMPIIRIQNLNDETAPFNYFNGNIDKKYIVENGDLLFSWSGTPGTSFGAFFWNRGRGVLNQHIFNVYPQTGLLKDYFRYALNGNLQKIISKAHGGVGLQHITKKELETIEIPIPLLDEQRRIAAVLDKVSDLIAKRREQLDKLDELVKVRFVEMFGDPVSNSKGWDKGTIRDVVSEVKYGTSKPAIDGGAYKYLRMGNITFDGRLDLSDLKYIDIPDSELEKYMVRKGDVLFNRTNSKELVGKTCVFDLNEPMVIAGYIIRVRVNSKVLPIYLSAVLNSQYGKQTLADMCKAIVGQANINAQELQDIAILIPPIELQEKFSDYAETIKKSKLTIQQSLDKLEVLRKALMQQYFG